MAIPASERPPSGLKSYWLAVWRAALKVLKDQGTWSAEQRPLLDEYVFALRGAEDARNGFKWLDALEAYAEDAEDLPNIAWSALATIATGLPVQWDRHTKRAAALADQLALTPRGRKAIGLANGAEDTPEDPFAKLDQGDQLAQARKRRAQAS